MMMPAVCVPPLTPTASCAACGFDCIKYLDAAFPTSARTTFPQTRRNTDVMPIGRICVSFFGIPTILAFAIVLNAARGCLAMVSMMSVSAPSVSLFANFTMPCKCSNRTPSTSFVRPFGALLIAVRTAVVSIATNAPSPFSKYSSMSALIGSSIGARALGHSFLNSCNVRAFAGATPSLSRSFAAIEIPCGLTICLAASRCFRAFSSSMVPRRRFAGFRASTSRANLSINLTSGTNVARSQCSASFLIIPSLVSPSNMSFGASARAIAKPPMIRSTSSVAAAISFGVCHTHFATCRSACEIDPTSRFCSHCALTGHRGGWFASASITFAESIPSSTPTTDFVRLNRFNRASAAPSASPRAAAARSRLRIVSKSSRTSSSRSLLAFAFF
mmetsp:Transcript_7003/g.15587  ORF Transcript_7003/g.15587 Transcript_7003/m.15587 type:complete len:388 (+) Transcript_7003:2561-3724(+)